MKIELQQGEVSIDTWSITYYPPGGRKINGKLTVTNRRLIYDAVFDISARELIPQGLFVKWGSVGYLEINKADIRTVTVKKNIFNREVVLMLVDGSKHIFCDAILTGNRMVKAIEIDRTGQDTMSGN